MKLLFDLVTIQPAWDAKYHGGGIYGEVVFFALAKHLCKFEMICIYDSKKYLGEDILSKCSELKIKLYDINMHKPKEIVSMENVDVFYTPRQQWERDWLLNTKRFVVTWHDFFSLELIYDRIIWNYVKSLKEFINAFARFAYPRFFFNRNRNRYKMMLERGVEFITDSNHSKASFLSFFPESKDKRISVLYPPMSRRIINDNFILPSGITEKKYFLLNSGSRWYKNNLRAILAFDALFSDMENSDFKVLLTGVTNSSVYEKKITNKNHFVFLDFVEPTMLEFLYAKAYAFVYPSLNEGFGYPPLEAMHYGVPVAASGTSSIPEICQNAAVYFDPYNVNEIKNRIIQLLDKDIYTEYSARAVERYKIVSKRQEQDLEKIVSFILGERL